MYKGTCWCLSGTGIPEFRGNEHPWHLPHLPPMHPTRLYSHFPNTKLVTIYGLLGYFNWLGNYGD